MVSPFFNQSAFDVSFPGTGGKAVMVNITVGQCLLTSELIKFALLNGFKMNDEMEKEAAILSDMFGEREVLEDPSIEIHGFCM